MGVFDSPLTGSNQQNTQWSVANPGTISTLASTTRQQALAPSIPSLPATWTTPLDPATGQRIFNLQISPTLKSVGNAYTWDYPDANTSGFYQPGQGVDYAAGPTFKTVGDLFYSYNTPESIRAAAAAQQAAITQGIGAVNQYASPTNYFRAPSYSTSVNAPNSVPGIQQNFGAAVGKYNEYSQRVKDVIDQYANEANLYGDEQARNQTALKEYMDAKNRFSAQALNEQGGVEGVTDVGQLFGQARSNFNPYMSLGQSSAEELGRLSGAQGAEAQSAAVQSALASPEIQSQLGMGTAAVSRLASASGNLRSGRVMKELQEFGQNLASNAIAQKRQALLSQAGIGSSAAQDIAGLYSAQNQAEMARAGKLSDLDVATNQAAFSQKQAVEQQRLAAMGLEQQNVSSIGNLLAQQAAQTTSAEQAQYDRQIAEARYNYETNLGAQKLTASDELRARQDYLNRLLDLYSAQGKVSANEQQQLGQRVGQISY